MIPNVIIKNIFEAYAYYAQLLLGPELIGHINKTILGFFFFILIMIIFYHIIEELLDLALRETLYEEHLSKTKKAIALLVTLLAVFSVGFLKAMFTFGLILALLGVGFMVYVIFYGLLRYVPGFFKKYSPWISFFIASGFVSWIVYENLAKNIIKISPPSPEVAVSIDWVETLQWVVIGILFLHALKDYFHIIREIGEYIGGYISGGISRFGGWLRGVTEELTREEREIKQEERIVEKERKEVQQMEREMQKEEKLLLEIKKYLDRGETPPKELLRRVLEEIQYLRSLASLIEKLYRLDEALNEKIDSETKRILEEMKKYGIYYRDEDVKRLLEKELGIEERSRRIKQQLSRDLNIEETILERIVDLLYNINEWFKKGEVNPEYLKEIEREVLETMYDIKKLEILERHIGQAIQEWWSLLSEVEEISNKILKELLQKGQK